MTGKDILITLYHEGVTTSDMGNGHIREDLKRVVGEWEIVADTFGIDYTTETKTIIHFIKHNVYIQIDGYNTSHYGREFNTAPYEIKKVTKTIETFEKI